MASAGARSQAPGGGRTRPPALLALLLTLALLSGCMLSSGERLSADVQPDAGNLSVSFVSVEGSEERVLETGQPGALNIIAIVAVDRGDLRLDLIDPTGAVVFAVQSSPNAQMSRSGSVPTDDQGRLRYRLVAQGARDASIQILYQRA